MKKIILAAILLLSNIAFAQNNQISLSKTHPTPHTANTPDPVVVSLLPNPSMLNENPLSNIKPNQYSTELKFYKEGNIFNTITLTGVSNEIQHMSSQTVISYISEITKDPETKEINKKLSKLTTGIDIQYLIKEVDVKNSTVLIKNLIEVSELIKLSKIYDTDKINYIDLPETVFKRISQVNLVKLGQETLLADWKDTQVKIVINKLNN